MLFDHGRSLSAVVTVTLPSRFGVPRKERWVFFIFHYDLRKVL